MSIALRGLRPSHVLTTLGVSVLFACGGADRDRPGELPAEERAPDPGSGPFSCESVPREGFGPWGVELEFWMLDDFELGAANGGWHPNSDICEDCQKLIDGRKKVSLFGAQLAAVQKALDTVQQQLAKAVPNMGALVPAVEELGTVSEEGEARPLVFLLEVPMTRQGNFPLSPGVTGLIEWLERYLPEEVEVVAHLRELEEFLPVLQDHAERLSDDVTLGDPENADLASLLEEDLGKVNELLVKLGMGEGSAEAPAPTGDLQKLTDRLVACKVPCDASETPNLFEKPMPAELIPGSRCGSNYAAHLRMSSNGYPALYPVRDKDWGGQLMLPLWPPADASEWEGISFWARVGPGSRQTFRTEVADVHTTDRPPAEGHGECDPDANDKYDNALLGCDKFGAFAVANSDWQFFAFPFAELRQKGWGLRAPYLDVWGIWSVGFMFDPGEWDIWIDDVAFYRRKQ